MATTESIHAELAQAEKDWRNLTKKLVELRRQASGETVEDYTFQRPNGYVKLSSLFDGRDDLILVHNMGKSCAYCTLWADGFNGLLPHLEDRAAFVLVSPDDPKAQEEFAAGRNWNFKMVSSQGSNFTKEMGYENNGNPLPGFSTFTRNSDRSIQRIAHAPFGAGDPSDPYCAAWHLFDLLKDGDNGWQAKFEY